VSDEQAEIALTWVEDDAGRRTPYPPFVDQAAVDALLAGLELRPTDVFVASYPKSGTTWLQQICHLLARGGVQGEEAVVDTVPWIEAHTLAEKPDLAALEAWPGRRWMQIHAPWSLAPKGAGARYIYVARNPRDVAVSFFHHQRAKQHDPAYTGDFAHFVAEFLAGRVPFGSWFDHVLGWWQRSRARDDVLFVRYEDMVRDLGRELDRIAAFVEVELGAELRAAIVEQSSFAHMKRLGIGEPKGAFRSRAGESAHLRKGKVGDWVNYFDAAQLADLDAHYRERLADTGLEFDFELLEEEAEEAGRRA
jgi:hypothetical protein